MVLCDKTFPRESQYTHLLIPDREPTRDQSTDTIKVQLGEQKFLLGLLSEAKKLLQTAASPKPTPARVTGHKAGNLESTKQPAGSSSVWRVSFLGAFVDSNLLQGALLVSASSRQVAFSGSFAAQLV